MSFWFQEETQVNGFVTAIEAEELLCRRQSRFQRIELYQSSKLGRVLMLDGIIQLTEFDEFVYHEMLANLPLFAHAAPRDILVIGGGDGGVLRELSRHTELRSIDICEIDGDVVEICKEFLPAISCGFDDPRVKLHIGDGARFVAQKEHCYDVIIVDSTDPGGPGEPLFGDRFYAGMKRALRPGGVIATQSESPFILSDVVRRINRTAAKLFSSAAYAGFHVPTYPSGMIGACVAGDVRDVTEPAREISPELAGVLRYYNAEVHRAAFAMPGFVKSLLS